ncbi:MAG: SAVED domain-containing protein [Candidatus Omnitrophica bacterium]|nr:SAVED domain-containing protein [Candidatus Omnitrophota bacterium]
MAKNKKRKSIPKEIVLKLWALTAGRCEFTGCNKPLWRDGLTWQEANFSHIAHIIAASPDGPRGDKLNSRKLAKDFSNLMLVCLDHHKLIDSKEQVKEYPVERLRLFKEQHEKRITIQTAAQDSMVTTILIFKANIGSRTVNIPFEHARQAIAPKFPSDNQGIVFDYTNLDAKGDSSYWLHLKSQIKDEVKLNIRKNQGICCLSVFAIGPIPLLAYLGLCIGNIIPCELYQKHRDTQRWAWKSTRGSKSFKFNIKKFNRKSRNRKVALILSLSGKIHRIEVEKVLGDDKPSYEISINHPSPLFLTSKNRLLQFQKAYRKLITEIRSQHGPKCEIHLFPAVPAPIAVMCGKELLPKVDPPLFVYDHIDNAQGFKFALKIN